MIYVDSKIENLTVYGNKGKNTKPRWGSQWDGKLMTYLLNLGAYKFFRKMLEERAEEPCLILGTKGEEYLIGDYYKKIIGVNIAKEEFCGINSKVDKYDLIVCDAEKLPFRNSAFRNVISLSFLHHVDLIGELTEIKRVTHDGGLLFLLEPGKFNFVAAMGRKIFPTNLHVKSEKPFGPNTLKKIISERFGQIEYEGYFHTFSIVIPILAKHIKLFNSEKILYIMEKIDSPMTNLFLRQFCWIIVLGIVKDDSKRKN